MNLPDISTSFHLAITQEVLSLVSKGHPTPSDIIKAPDPTHSTASANAERGRAGKDEELVKKLTIETSAGDVRLWVEILRNLTKDLPKVQSIQVAESMLAGLRMHREAMEEREMASSPPGMSSEHYHHQLRQSTLVAFSCGHTYTQDQFQNRILPEFVERVGGFPMGIPQTLRQLQFHYKQSQCYPSACPHCVFLFLRKIQLEECPKVPIRPWNI